MQKNLYMSLVFSVLLLPHCLSSSKRNDQEQRPGPSENSPNSGSTTPQTPSQNKSSQLPQSPQVPQTSTPTSGVPTPPIGPIPHRDLGLVRPAVAENPITPGELATATDQYVALLKATRYFHVLDERIHGWPQSDSTKPPFGIWWIGVQLERRQGSVVYRHADIGSDNAATDTAMMLENLCYAHNVWGPGFYDRTLTRTVLGLTALVQAMNQSHSLYDKVMLSRSFYPTPVTSNDLDVPILFDYSRARPGADNSATVYVHITDNPMWGDIYIKNKRSKDDMGHVLRAIAQVRDSCGGNLDANTNKALDDLKNFYALWAQQVVNDGYTIATRDQSGAVYLPSDTLANFTSLGGVECNAKLSLTLFGYGQTMGNECGDGTNGLINFMSLFTDKNLPILESYHVSALMTALDANQLGLAKTLAGGLITRMTGMLSKVQAGQLSSVYSPPLVAGLLTRAMALGIPLTGNEARWVQGQIAKAAIGFTTNDPSQLYDFLHQTQPDGVYPYNPQGAGFLWRDIGSIAGTCGAMWAATGGQPIVDCDRLRAAMAAF